MMRIFFSQTNNINNWYSYTCTILLIIIFTCSITSCEQKTEYERRLETELSKNTRVDSLFLGYHFGMTTEEFFEYSWDLNKREIVTGQSAVTFKIENLKSPAIMSFYPQFKDNKIYKMPVQVQYEGWAPWNRSLFSDSLMVDLVELYEKKYRGDFFKAIHPESNKEAYIDIQGNRRISIFEHDDRIVNVEFLDLTVVENNL